jgi:hypothetical protein
MKTIFTILFFVSSFTLIAQSDNVAGVYDFSMGGDDSKFDYKLTLNPDGTFFFSYYSYIKNGIPPEKKKSAQGKWTVDKNVVTFFSSKQLDTDNKETLDFTNTKARFITKSPRNKTDQVIKTRLQFLESDIPWMSTIEMFKI